MSAQIPIRKLYHLLCYAWDVLPQGELLDIQSSDENHPLDLLAEVLVKGTNHLLRRGVEQDYQSISEVSSILRGRIDFPYSARRLLLDQGKARCTFDEITSDILPNQIIRTTFLKLSRMWGIDKSLRKQCGVLVKRFDEVSAISLKPNTFSQVRMHRNNRFYRFLIDVCELIHAESLLDEKSGRVRFRDFFRDEGKMPRLYEKFIFNFYAKKQSEYRVTSERIRWSATSDDDPELSMLPSMLTDVSLRSRDRTIILDAKYYKETLSSFHGNKKIHSNNLYQLFAYLQNIALNGGNDEHAVGILLYPVIGEEVKAQYELLGTPIRIETVDLSSDWQNIEAKLLSIIN